MIKLNLTGYVNSVRTNTLSSGKKVTNVKINVPVSKVNDKQTYQSFDIAFWEKFADNAVGVKEKDYVIIPDVIISKFETSQGKDNKTYINISGSANVVFKALEKAETEAPETDPVMDNNPF